MKAIELMVGDYLMHNGSSYRVIQVDGIVRDGWMIENGEEDCGEPIPITKEILEKNGIRYQFGHPWWQAAEMEDGVFEIHLTEKSTMLLKYVHELQHALKLCGINKNIEP